MREIYKSIFVGNKEDYYCVEDNRNFDFCLCAKTYHKEYARLDGADFDGYTGNMNNSESEYLIAERPLNGMLAVNLIDAPKVEYIPKVIIDRCIKFIDESENKYILIACDRGESRSVGIAFMYGIKQGFFDDCKNYSQALEMFRQKCETINFGKGIEQYTINYWNEYQIKRGVVDETKE